MHTAQDKSADKSSVPQRLERLRVHTQSTWEQVAERIGITSSMLYQVKRGDRQLSSKAIFRLEMAEKEARLMPMLEGIPHLPVTVDLVGGESNEQLRATIKMLRQEAAKARERAAQTLGFAEELERSVELFERRLQERLAPRRKKA
jgi:transcriptional regulator with XRE-family HTH domain